MSNTVNAVRFGKWELKHAEIQTKPGEKDQKKLVTANLTLCPK